jgi:hypothetical protein
MNPNSGTYHGRMDRYANQNILNWKVRREVESAEVLELVAPLYWRFSSL